MNDSLFFRNTLLDFLQALIVRGSGAPLAFIASVLIARYLGVEAFGSYVVLLATAYLYAGLAPMGADQVLIREIAAAKHQAGHQSLGEVGQWGLQRFAITGGLSTLLLMIWLQLNPWSEQIGWWELVATVLLGWACALSIIVASLLLGRGATTAAQALVNPIRNGLLLALVALIALVASQADRTAAMILAQATTFLIIAQVGWYWLRRRHGGLALKQLLRKNRDVTGDRHRSWNRSARVFFIGTAATLLLNRLDVILVSYLSDESNAGLYGAALRTGELAALVAHAGSLWLQPRVAHCYREHHHDALDRLMRRTGIWIVAASACLVIGILFTADAVVLLFGPEFVAAANPLRLIATGYLIWAVASPLFVYLSMAGAEGTVARILALQLTINVILTLILVPRLGVLGASLSWLGAISAASLLFIVQGLRHLKSSAVPRGGAGNGQEFNGAL